MGCSSHSSPLMLGKDDGHRALTVTQPAEAARGTATAEMPETAPPPDPCSIVINSGRCGSTLLSRLIAEEPETLSASESLGPIRDRRAAPDHR